MADDKTHVGSSDRDRISLGTDEVRDWAESRGLHPETLRAATDAAGSSADAVRAFLKTA